MQKIDTGKLPIYSWADFIEEGAMRQAMNLALHPYTFDHIAIMPDCVTNNTEILTNSGFKKITDISFDEIIANYDPSDEKIKFLRIRGIINRPLRPDETVYELQIPSINKTIRITENHRLAYASHMGILAKNLPETTQIKDFVWTGCGTILPDYDISDELLCLIAWVVGDGNIKKSGSSTVIRFGLTKERKIKRICMLCDALGYSYNIRNDKRQVAIELRTKSSETLLKIIGESKEYPNWFLSTLSTRQALLFLNEAIQVDGDYVNYLKYNSYRYNSTRDSDIKFLSALISIHFGISIDRTRYTDGYKLHSKLNYLDAIPVSSIFESKSGYGCGKVIKKRIEYSENVVCVTCDTGFFVARQNGLTFVTGNCHQGYGVPIGGVAATKSVIIPEAVGVDIGCGMQAVKTDIQNIERSVLENIVHDIKGKIPVGFDHRSESLWAYMPAGYENLSVVNREYDSACHQLGTLGGGNHFLEIQKGDDGFIWAMVHSGSRNLGKKVADHYIKIATEETEKSDVTIPKKWELDYLYVDSQYGNDYIKEMNYCLQFAKASRSYMINVVKSIISEHNTNVCFHPEIDIHHNYAEPLKYNGVDLILHRKGATAAEKGQIGIIPGSQGTASYIVEGRGNPQSFFSCSHGSGRKMARGVAKRNLSLEDEQQILDTQGIIHDMKTASALDEAPGAYKDIHIVMENQKDLVKPLVRLSTLAVIKG